MKVFKKSPVATMRDHLELTQSSEGWIEFAFNRLENPAMVTCTYRNKRHSRDYVEKTLRCIAGKLRRRAYGRQVSKKIDNASIAMFVASIEEHKDGSLHVHCFLSRGLPKSLGNLDGPKIFKETWERLTGNGNVQIDESDPNKGGLKGLLGYGLKNEQRDYTSGRINVAYWDYYKYVGT